MEDGRISQVDREQDQVRNMWVKAMAPSPPLRPLEALLNRKRVEVAKHLDEIELLQNEIADLERAQVALDAIAQVRRAL